MSHKKIILGLFVATLGASFVHQASAQWGTGGATSIPRKSHPLNVDLFCDLSRLNFGTDTISTTDQVKITALPSHANSGAAPSFKFAGQMFCAEVPAGTLSPRLEDAVEDPLGTKLVGKFKLIQRSPLQNPPSTYPPLAQGGLLYNGPTSPTDGVRTWTFYVPGAPVYPFPELLYDLAPANDATAAKFCHSFTLGDETTYCKALFGLQLPAKQSDYPARDLDNSIPLTDDLAIGEVFRFTTTTTGGVEAPGRFFWGPCHSPTFDKPTAVVQVDAKANASHDGGQGVPTGRTLTGAGTARLAVTVNQNDLWNSGDLPRWSNADGQFREMKATGQDESLQLLGTLIGTDGSNPAYPFGQLASDATHRLHVWTGTTWSLLPIGATAPWGVLVGSVDGTNFYVFGTAFDGKEPPVSGELKLYYWDTPRGDNTQFVTVTVAADSIQCTDDAGNASVRGDVWAERAVKVQGLQSTLNVASKSTTAVFPVAVLGCTAPPVQPAEAAITFLPNGSPINVVGTTARVSRGGLSADIPIKGFSVAEVVLLPSCDNNVALADLKVDLDQKQFINFIAPGGVCVNGPVTYHIRLGDATAYFGGDASVSLNKCKP